MWGYAAQHCLAAATAVALLILRMARAKVGACYVLRIDCSHLLATWARQQIVAVVPVPPNCKQLEAFPTLRTMPAYTQVPHKWYLIEHDGSGTDGCAGQHSERAPQPPRPLPTAATLVAPVCDLRSPAPPRAAPEVCEQPVVLCPSMRLLRRPEHHASCLQPRDV